MSELKTCPFCGGEAVLRYGEMSVYPYGRRYRVWCKNCNIMTNMFRTKEEAVSAWNFRINEE